MPLLAKIRHAGRFGNQEHIGNRVGHDPIDLLGHRAVKAPQPGLDVGHGHAQLDCGQRCGHGGVNVPDDHHPIKLPASAAGSAEAAPNRSTSGPSARRVFRSQPQDICPAAHVQVFKKDVREDLS